MLHTKITASVLIETLWNVKIHLNSFFVPPRSINRNIMECKDYCGMFFHRIKDVLIETLWNVKTNFMQNDNIENLY